MADYEQETGLGQRLVHTARTAIRVQLFGAGYRNPFQDRNTSESQHWVTIRQSIGNQPTIGSHAHKAVTSQACPPFDPHDHKSGAPIKPNGNFVSEAYRDGRTYFFEAFYSARQWSAEIWDADGRIRGCITCLPLADRLETDGLEDAVCDWVHRAIAHEVGITVGLEDHRDHRGRSASRQMTQARGADGHKSANADMFHLPRSATPEEIKGAALRLESRLLVARFREVAEQWNVRWDPSRQVRKLALPA